MFQAKEYGYPEKNLPAGHVLYEGIRKLKPSERGGEQHYELSLGSKEVYSEAMRRADPKWSNIVKWGSPFIKEDKVDTSYGFLPSPDGAPFVIRINHDKRTVQTYVWRDGRWSEAESHECAEAMHYGRLASRDALDEVVDWDSLPA
ncbi:MAG: hypothetical protein LC130_03510 [Bryobacterales bacterium]|nr:hypothetical protein [Bryobacterales bacterium]